MTVELGILIAIIGCFVALAGWLAGRDKKISNDAEWRGTVNAKLDTIHNDIGGVSTDIKVLQNKVNDHGERIARLEKTEER